MMAKEGRGVSVDTTSNPGRAIGRGVAAGEAVEHELDAFKSRRYEQRLKSEAEREAEAAWRASEKLQEAARRRGNRVGWYSWHAHRAELYGRLSREHEAAAQAWRGSGGFAHDEERLRRYSRTGTPNAA